MPGHPSRRPGAARQRVTRAPAVNPSGSPRAPTSLARGDRPARACRPFRHRRTPCRNPETENTMDLEALIAHWSGQVPPGFVPHAVMRRNEQKRPCCCQRRCRKPVAIKDNGEYAKSCSDCLARRARSCRRRRRALTAAGGCRRCAYRPRRCIARATSTSACRPGTRARRLNPRRPTGRRCQTRYRNRIGYGSSPSTTTADVSGAASCPRGPGAAAPVTASAAAPKPISCLCRLSQCRAWRAPSHVRSSAAPPCRSASSRPSGCASAARPPPAASTR